MLPHPLCNLCFFLLAAFFFSSASVLLESVAADIPILPRCNNTSHEIELDNPDVFEGGIGTIRTYEGCMQRKRDRLVVVSQERSRVLPTSLPPCRHFQERNETLVLHYLSSDLCRMGHTTKDVPHLMTFLLDYLSPCAASCSKHPLRLRVHLTIIFGNACMSYPVWRRDASFRRVIYGWYEAVFRADSPFVALLHSWGVDLVASGNTTKQNEVRFDQIFFAEVSTSKTGGFFCRTRSMSPKASVMRVLVRWERFRWFRTRAQAALFRQCLLWYYKTPKGPASPGILILRRPNERHFDEQKWYGTLNKQLKHCGISVAMHTFESITYKIQASLVHNASVFIGAHGAGMVNMVAMQPGSVVIELFPHGFRYAMYQELADLLDLHYIAYESSVVWPTNCCRVMGCDLSTNFTPPLNTNPLIIAFGQRHCKECDIKILPEDMDAIIHDAIELAASSTRFRNPS